MFLQILINHYHESEAIVGRLLSSIETQIGIQNGSLEVLLYSDGNDRPLSDSFLSQFTIPICHKVLSHRGVCATRNALLDDASAEWVMFCDADDCFHSSLGLYRLYKATRDLSVDVIGSPYEKENPNSPECLYKRMERDTIRLHGKIFRRQYLVDNDIRFPDELPYSGDMYFLWQAYNLKQNFAWLRDSFYVWKYNPESITRKDPFARLKTYPLVLRNYELLSDKLLERGRMDLFKMLAASILCMIYLDTTNSDFMNGPVEYLLGVNTVVCQAVQRYTSVALQLPEPTLRRHYDNSLRVHPEGDESEGFSGFYKWLQEIQQK